jgi:hypothetical protein
MHALSGPGLQELALCGSCVKSYHWQLLNPYVARRSVLDYKHFCALKRA